MGKSLNLFKRRLRNILSPREGVSQDQQIRQIIEALLFSSHEPVSIDKLRETIASTFAIGRGQIQKILSDLKAECETHNRGFQLDEIAGGYLLRSAKEAAPYVEQMHQSRRGEKISKAGMEVLAIIAYKQPITRGEINQIRSVDSSGPLRSLLDRNLIQVVGQASTPGRPRQFGTTKEFLKHFGLKSAKDLPTLTDELNRPD